VASAAERPRTAPARACAYRVIRRVFEEGAYADRALHAEAQHLDPRDRALAMQLVYGTVQRKRTLDHVLTRLSSRPPERLDTPVLAALRLGLFQLAFLNGIAEHAAVHESVELVKQHAHGGAGLVNAVLRRATRERADLLAGLNDETLESAAILHSVPDWLAEMWWRELGPEEARQLLGTINQPPESALRINTLKGEAELPVPAHAAPGLPEGRVLEAPFDLFGSELWSEGRVMPQSRGSMRVVRSLAPLAGERVLDACAAPGAKTTHLAALMENRGEVVAVEVHPGRATALNDVCQRMGADCVRVLNADAAELTGELGQFDRVLVDPPCSGLGTLQSRPDLRWQERRGEIDATSEQQLRLLSSAAARLKRTGTLVYSVCTISRREGPELVRRFLEGAEDFRLEVEEQLLPHRDGTDGFYIARLIREGPQEPDRPLT
jgi:16S rRNA (cytosine967-C5)-methyltransferase